MPRIARSRDDYDDDDDDDPSHHERAQSHKSLASLDLAFQK